LQPVAAGEPERNRRGEKPFATELVKDTKLFGVAKPHERNRKE